MQMRTRLISLVVAMDRNRVIGANGRLPWRLPDDMRHFREVTMGKPVILGRKTYASIPARFRPLPGRHNIVVTRNQTYAAPGATVVHSPEAALAAAGDVAEVIIGGGAALYAAFLPLADRLYLTLVDGAFAGDTFSGPFDAAAWREAARETHAADDRHAVAFAFVTLVRRGGYIELE